MMPGADFVMVVDLEATCSRDKSILRADREIIEIGAVMVAVEGWQPVSEFQSFVRPVIHPTLTDFCTELTGIAQADVETTPLFPQVLEKFHAWSQGFDRHVFGSWGNYDRKQFEQDCLYHRRPFPITAPHVNLKAQFSKQLGLRKRHGMASALKIAKLDLVGAHHRGIDDARNIARLLPLIFPAGLV